MLARKPFVRITVQSQAPARPQAPTHNQPLPLPASITQLQVPATDHPFQLPSIEEIRQRCHSINTRKTRKLKISAQKLVEPFSPAVITFLQEKFDRKTDLGMAQILAAKRFLKDNETFFKDFQFMADNNRLDEDPSLEQSLLRESRFGLDSLDIKIEIIDKPSGLKRQFITYGLKNAILIPILQKHYKISEEGINKIKEFIAPFNCFTFFINTQYDEEKHFIRIFRILTVKFLYDPKYVK